MHDVCLCCKVRWQAHRAAGTAQWYGRDGLGDVPDAEPAAAAVGLKPAPGMLPSPAVSAAEHLSRLPAQGPWAGSAADSTLPAAAEPPYIMWGAGHAAIAIAQAANTHRGRLKLVAIGPLTNVALACGLDSALPSKVAGLVIMGGSAHPEPEFNFAGDPLAARTVRLRLWLSLTCMPLQPCSFALECCGPCVGRQERTRQLRCRQQGWVSCKPRSPGLACRCSAAFKALAS